MSRGRIVALLCALAAVPAGALFLSPRAQATGPEAIRYDRDTCAHCRMHFAARGFAAERRDEKGALHKYDDIGCMLIAASRAASGEAWVEDHAGGGFVPLLTATLVAGKDLGTPMGYGVVAFRDPAAAARYAKAHAAKVVALEDLLHDESRFGAHHEEVHR
ncbi:MAG TPA: nitrous oxide reductase accessory protein NosL [Myxococcales bacterium]|nr:nitrous oxide reductase accessory protein NosL [Myxococcales bacterium]